MELNQYKSDWQQKMAQTSLDERVDWKKQMIKLEDKMVSLDKNVKKRTLYGACMFVLMLVSMTASSYLDYLLHKSLLTTLGYASWITVIAISMVRLFNVKKHHKINDNALAIKESLIQKLSKVDIEIQFYLTLWWKVLVPLSPGFVLTIAGAESGSTPAAGTLALAAGISVTFILCCYFSYRYNKYYVAKNLTPIKEDIEANLKALSEEY
jgi:hypothetical protein